MTVTAAMADVGRTFDTYKNWKNKDPVFMKNANAARQKGAERKIGFEAAVPDFPLFSAKYLNAPLGEHH